MIKNVYLAGCSRTPIGAFNGVFAEFSAVQLGSVAVRAALQKAGVDAAHVDEVIFGNVLSAGLGQSVARQVALGAGLPTACGAVTINKMCGSAMRAVRLAAQAVQCGDADVVVAGGTENMTRAPYLLLKGRSGYRLGNGEVLDSLLCDGLTDAYAGVHMGVCGEKCAAHFGFSREAQDDFAIASFKRALAAQSAGHTLREIATVEVPGRKGPTVISMDEELAKFDEGRFRALKPVFSANGTITAGNASAISDGAAAVVVLSEEKARALGVRCDARILGYAGVAQDPEWFTTAPIGALRRLSEKINLRLADVDLFEINEAFSCVPMVAMRELNLPHEKVNVFGGAVAIGHPIGASGARIVATLVNALRTRGGRRGVATACIGGGEAGALALELCKQ